MSCGPSFIGFPSKGPFKQPRSVQVVVFRNEAPDQRLYLLLRRLKDRGGMWQTVTGSLEPAETHPQAAVREIGEETGWSITESDLIDLHLTNTFEIAPEWRSRYAAGVTRNQEVCFCLRACAQSVVLDEQEHDACQWRLYQEALSLFVYDSNKRALEATEKLLGAMGQGPLSGA